jgi:phosphoglycerol transferase MdoB-like AlkP superfamily enzyme
MRRRVHVAGWVESFVCQSDAIWASTALLAKPFLVINEALLEPRRVAYWLMIVCAVAPVLAVALVVGERPLRRWILFGFGVVATITVLSDIVYFRFFGDVLSVSALMAVRQTPRLVATIRSLLTLRLFWLVVDLPFALWLIIELQRDLVHLRAPEGRPWRLSAVVVGGLVLAGLLISAPSAVRAAELNQMFRNGTVIEHLGVFGFHAYDAWLYTEARAFRPALTRAERDAIARWFAARAPLRTAEGSPVFGLAARKSLIVVQVESLQDFVVDYRVGGELVMPHLARWTADSWRFTNVTDQTNEGRTSDAEFTTMVSLLPLDHGAVAFQYPENGYVGLPRVLAQHGYSTLSAVAFEPSFWNRSVMHPLYGFARSYFESDFRMTEQIGWGLNDRDFLQQMVPRLETQRRPFCAWLITLSLHHPYESFPDSHKTLKLGPLEGTPFGNYLHTMRFFDQALEDFKNALARSGLLDDSVVVVFGDHDAGFAREAALARQIGVGADEAGWELADRIPLFIRPPHAPGQPAMADHIVGIPAGQTDLAPTVLGLLGIDAGRLPYMGRNLLGNPGNPPIVRPFGDWIDREHLLISHSDDRRSCYSLAKRAFVDGAECADAETASREARDVSRLVILEDLQQEIRGRLVELVP